METHVKPDPAVFSSRVPPKNILAPIDFSECSLAGLEAAKNLAVRWNSRVEIVQVDPGPPVGLFQGMGSPEERRRIAKYYGEREARLKEAGQQVPKARWRLLDGDPGEVLSMIAAGAGFDLVVMGTHGRQGLTRLALGSVAERIVHASRVPVLTVHSQPKPRWPSRILVPMKHANYADRALLCALDWARSLRASLSVMHVAEEPERQQFEDSALDEHLFALLGREDFDKLGRIIYRGGVEESILGEARAGAFDLVILAEHFRTYWSDLIVGTTAERVLRLSAVPVLSVPPLSAFANENRLGG